ncbi:MAG TPA: hypothetical protein PKY12_15595, partial [Catalimonadaceae bacterium]|nr:hypothetical protein [Catalimonadaceae bacterium]
GDSVTLTSSAASGNIWSTGATTQSIKVKTTGNFTVQVVLAGCSSAVSAATSVVVNTPPTSAVITSSGGFSFCSGSSITLQSDQSTLLQWQRNGININGQTNATLTVSTVGTYRVVRSQNGCSTFSNELTINENTSVPPVPAISSGGQTSFCSNASLGLISSAETGNQWIKDGSDIPGATSNALTITTAGTYAVRVSQGGCFSTSANLVLTTKVVPTIGISTSAPAICEGNLIELSTTGTALSSHEWLKEGITTNQFGATFSTSTAGSYSVIGTAANGCSATSSAINVQADVVPALTSNKPANTICSGSSITLTSTPGTSFLWSNSATTGAITVSPTTDTEFSVRTTGALGCEFNDTIQVVVVPTVTPAAVTNLLPENGSINQESNIVF